MIARVTRPEGALARLREAWAVVVERFFTEETCERWTRGVCEARAEWTNDFDGEQFTLGRAFYTHFEEDKSRAYFADVESSDARVERHVPGLQSAMRDLVSRTTGGHVCPRRGWCGPGVHVFPAKNPVARRGGVVHFDTEGLVARHIERRSPAVTLVAMLRPPISGGGLQVWNARYDGHDHATPEDLARPSTVITYACGDVILIDSYRLHQIQPFGGALDRISATVHAAEVDRGLWETWF